jgi:hypothetical protein
MNRIVISRIALCALVSLGLLSASVVSAQELAGEGERAGTKVVVRDIKRDDGGTVTLRFRMVSTTDTPAQIYQLLGGYLDSKVHLMDAAGKKKYLVVKDTTGKCECTAINGNVTKDAPVNLWAKFPAPPATVQKITVVVGGFEPIESVPITER